MLTAAGAAAAIPAAAGASTGSADQGGARALAAAQVAAGTGAAVTSAPRPGAQLWVRRYAGSGNQVSWAAAVAVGPGGRKVFVTGTSGRTAATIAYSAVTGARLWTSRYAGPSGSGASGGSIAVSPHGGRVFVAARTSDAAGADYATIAYDAVTGAPVWRALYNGPGNGIDYATALRVSPDGSTVYVTGFSTGRISGPDYATIAYSAATGRQLWIARLGRAGTDAATSIAVGPAGTRVFVTGRSDGAATGGDYATAAYNAKTGKRLWVSRYNGPAAGKQADDYASSVAVGPGGGIVFVTGTSSQESGGRLTTATTIAYSAATGRRLWLARYNGQAGGGAGASVIVASPAGGAVFVTGFSGVVLPTTDYATIAYNAFTGKRLWLRTYNGHAHGYDIAASLAVNPGGSKVFTTGFSSRNSVDFATVAYSAATGTQLWARRYDGPAGGDDFGASVAVSPGGSRLFVTGASARAGAGNVSDYLTIAYQP